MKKLIIFGIVGLVLVTAECVAQQRPVFSTYMFNGLMLNPAYAGSQDLFSATVTNRNQWVNIEGAPNFQSVAAHTTWVGNRVGTGLVVTRDAVGAHEQYGVYGSYAYKIRMAHGILAMGLQGGFDNRKSDFSRINLKDPNDPFLTGVITKFNPNFGAGLYYANPTFFLGISVPYILNSKIFKADQIASDEREARYYYINAGNVMDLSPHVKLNPSFLLRIQERSSLGYDINANLIFDDIIYAGVSYRSGDAIVFLTQLVLNENFRIGYAYDTVSSSLNAFTAGTHEIMLNYRRKIKNLKKNPQCPVYF